MRLARAAQVLAINAVSIYGVFGAHWPVGTAIALYWCENVLRLVILVAMSRRAGKLAGVAVLFNAVHAVFLAVILGAVIPRVAPAERFELDSFRIGIACIAILLAVELLLPQPTETAYFRRVLVIHLVIVFGMFGIVLFDRATILFGAFAALKVIADLASAGRRDSFRTTAA